MLQNLTSLDSKCAASEALCWSKIRYFVVWLFDCYGHGPELVPAATSVVSVVSGVAWYQGGVMTLLTGHLVQLSASHESSPDTKYGASGCELCIFHICGVTKCIIPRKIIPITKL